MIEQLLKQVVQYTFPEHAQRIATEYLTHKKVPYTLLRDQLGNIYGILFETYILDLETHEIHEIH